MGLDQYAYIPDHAENPDFVWRKHAKLQEFMENLFVQKTGQCDTKLNCGELLLDADDIAALEALVADEFPEPKH